MRRRRYRYDGSGRPSGSAGALRRRLPGERHLTGQQLVDLVIGEGSRTGERPAGHHLAVCALCRQDLDNLRDVDRQLELEGGRLAAIPRTAPPRVGDAPWSPSARLLPWPGAARGEDEVEAVVASLRRWRRIAVPLMAAVCAVFVLGVAVATSQAPGLDRDREVEVARVVDPPFGPVFSRWTAGGAGQACDRETLSFPAEPSARRPPGRIEAPPAAIEVAPSAMASTKAIDDGPGMPAAAPRAARIPAVRRAAGSARRTDAASRVVERRHPGAGRNDDRISPPSRTLGV